MADRELWYLKTEDGIEYGPAERDQLVSWAREGRIDSACQVSTDRENWTPAPLMPDLDMRWLVETEFGQYYGPFHKDVVAELANQKLIPPGARVFCLSEVDEEREASAAELQRALDAATARVSELESDMAEFERCRTELVRCRADAQKLRRQLEQARKKSGGFLSWLFGTPSMPDFSWLERAARLEIERMARNRRGEALPFARKTDARVVDIAEA